MADIVLAKSAGFCFGVKRAVETVMAECASRGSVYTLGSVIHNREVMAELKAKGARVAANVDDVPDGAPVVIRAHGVGRDVYRALEEKGCVIIDATCPSVARIHAIAEKESAAGRHVVIVGMAAHPETIGTAGWCDGAEVIENDADLDTFVKKASQNSELRPSVLAQTTSNNEFFEKCKVFIKKACKYAVFFDTICGATSVRQEEAREMAEHADAMVVIGDRDSSNTRRLVDICRKACPCVVFSENADGIDKSVLPRNGVIGVTAGSSTPERVIKEVVTTMSEETNVNKIAEAAEDSAESFEAMLDQSFKTLYTGEKVTGVVTAISGNEVYVDLGVKQAGFIPVSELSDDPTYKVEEHIKIGDEIETFVMRVNDVEGVIMLSKKRLDSVKGWEDIEQAAENKSVVEGYVTEENKGGIVVSVGGVRVFVPASQSGLPKDQPMTQLIKKKVRLVITEVNRQRRRVVGSIRAVLAKERHEAAEKIWATIEPGAKYSGVVKSLTSYGAFIDIGGVDGMAHVSELSWSRIRHPSEVLSVGQPVDVYVISVDKEKKKISLGYKTAETNPWNMFEKDYKVGMTVPVRVVKFMPFGAFAEVLPGVDGLIHISQIADHRIAKPDDVLKIGETVDAKITDVDWEKKKISLSIRALLEGDAEPEEIEAEEPEA